MSILTPVHPAAAAHLIARFNEYDAATLFLEACPVKDFTHQRKTKKFAHRRPDGIIHEFPVHRHVLGWLSAVAKSDPDLWRRDAVLWRKLQSHATAKAVTQVIAVLREQEF